MAMAKIYYKRIKAKIMDIEQVPSSWRAQTQALLDAVNAVKAE